MEAIRSSEGSDAMSTVPVICNNTSTYNIRCHHDISHIPSESDIASEVHIEKQDLTISSDTGTNTDKDLKEDLQQNHVVIPSVPVSTDISHIPSESDIASEVHVENPTPLEDQGNALDLIVLGELENSIVDGVQTEQRALQLAASQLEDKNCVVGENVEKWPCLDEGTGEMMWISKASCESSTSQQSADDIGYKQQQSIQVRENQQPGFQVLDEKTGELDFLAHSGPSQNGQYSILNEQTGEMVMLYDPSHKTPTKRSRLKDKRYLVKDSHKTTPSKIAKERRLQKHRIACRKSRRSKTMFKKAVELSKNNVEVLVVTKDSRGDISYWDSPGEMGKNFIDGVPLVKGGTKVYRINPNSWGIDESALEEVKTPTPRKRKGKVGSVVGELHIEADEVIVSPVQLPAKKLVKTRKIDHAAQSCSSKPDERGQTEAMEPVSTHNDSEVENDACVKIIGKEGVMNPFDADSQSDVERNIVSGQNPFESDNDNISEKSTCRKVPLKRHNSENISSENCIAKKMKIKKSKKNILKPVSVDIGVESEASLVVTRGKKTVSTENVLNMENGKKEVKAQSKRGKKSILKTVTSENIVDLENEPCSKKGKNSSKLVSSVKKTTVRASKRSLKSDFNSSQNGDKNVCSNVKAEDRTDTSAGLTRRRSARVKKERDYQDYVTDQ